MSSEAGLSRSGSLTDWLRTSFKGGMSSFKPKKPQDNARLKARLSKEPPSRPSSAAAAEHINDKTQDGKPVELPTKEPERKPTAETTNSSVIDPDYSPNKKAFRKSGGKPTIPAGQSFFEDSSSDEEPESPVLQRASSVRVANPVLVRNVSNATGAVSHSTPLRKHDERPITPENNSDAKDGPADALRMLEANSAKPLPMPSTPPASQGHSTTTSTLGGDITASPASTVFSNVQAASSPPSTPPITITTPLPPLSALRSNPVTPTTELTSARLSRALSAPTPPNRNPNRRVTIRPSDLVIGEDHDHKLFRDSVITTPYPGSASDSLANKNKRLSDIPDEPSRANSVGSTAKPPIQLLSPHALTASPHGPGDRDRFPSLTSTESLLVTLSLFGKPNTASTVEVTIPLAATQPRQPLSLRRETRKERAARPNLTAPDFDDSNLFTLLRKHYHSHLVGGRAKRVCLLPTRTLSNATSIPASDTMNTNDIAHLNDPYDFLAHLREPSLGKGKRNYLLWLRNNQSSGQQVNRRGPSSSFSTAATIETPVAVTATETGFPANEASPVSTSKKSDVHPAFGGTFLSSPTTTLPSIQHSTTSNNSKVSYPRMPFQTSHAYNAASVFAHGALPPSTKPAQATGPHIALHHRTNLLTLSLAGFLVFLAGLITVIVWVLVGVPGLAAGQRELPSFHEKFVDAGSTTDVVATNATALAAFDTYRVAASYGDWHVDAQMRVLTALVMGGVVWFGGGVAVLGWWAAGWMLL
ncbi:uncharacterized protein AB675_7579 [Cyphellophora attinorum]|uniref:Uncharacterized protein n=1 Tax=Cyphellophora attinorum TaxID=1664694 RepID=A0A0N1NYL7_9EURO|nr:uncharacterized protein AB675_7579 [Phialophora attinorum]KPI40380.1 hypothetical protein AB675_7579 [Phialophora attinorum]